MKILPPYCAEKWNLDLFYPMLETLNIAVGNIQKRPRVLISDFNFEGRANLIGRKAFGAIFSTCVASIVTALL